uniref:Candidate secreted effector n=1 Tax=Meloidogyne incognita TaxID=6306 RepID=A0A914NTI2_MELIC
MFSQYSIKSLFASLSLKSRSPRISNFTRHATWPNLTRRSIMARNAIISPFSNYSNHSTSVQARKASITWRAFRTRQPILSR